MAKQSQSFQFGDQETADIKLLLIGENGDEENHVYLHSQVLKKSEFYEAWLSPRWSLDEWPRELKISYSVSVEVYMKCFQFMYSCEADESYCFSGVDEALAILPVASEILFHEGTEQCMKYLNAVRWSPEQEAKLRAMLFSLQINILPELAARLGVSQLDKSGNLDMLKQTLQDMLSIISGRSNNSLPRTEVEKCIVGYYKAANTTSAKAVADTCRSALLEEFRANVERIISTEFSDMKKQALRGWSALLWLFDVSRRCDGKLYETFIIMFCEDGDLCVSAKYSHVAHAKVKADILLDRILNALGNGEVITPASFRVSFLTNWMDTLVKLIQEYPVSGEKLSALERGIMDVADTLPLADQKLVYNTWKDALKRLSMDQSNALKWWAQKVQDAILNGNII